ncbi:putative plastid-lipid-associated protein 14 [Forsythia ovata]|uniref:Plastid-lipid-associated protein 14 n=1 Tax=Forsythia ovata TaxID=205694 RepID=A0ABD1SQG9_9LAMI
MITHEASKNTENVNSLLLWYHSSFSLRHWLQQSDWLPTLEATLALDEDSVRRVGDDTVGGPAVSRHLRLIRILMRDLVIRVNYLHNHGLPHTELRLENLHICPVDIHVVILGNAFDFHQCSPDDSKIDSYVDRRQMMIAFDMRCIGFIVAKMMFKRPHRSTDFLEVQSIPLQEGVNEQQLPNDTHLEEIPVNDPDAGLKIMMSVLGVKSGVKFVG